METTVFGAAHLRGASWYAGVIGAWAAWEGWIVRRNNLNVREVDLPPLLVRRRVVTAVLLVDEREREVRITFPAISF